MPTYLPLARKYRPQSLEELIGQPHVTTTLTQALKAKRVGQAYLFAGPRGVGKTSAARILAKCVDCAKGPTATPCQACTNCVQITQGNSLDVIEIDGASNRGIEEIRTLRDSVAFAAAGGGFRIYIIDEVHMLTTEAFNALLKTLEEPPAHVKFIFATTAPNKVPSTILSRCQRFDFRRVDVPTIVKQLQHIAAAENISVKEPAFYAMARAADGSFRDAEVLLDQASSFSKGTIQEADIIALLGAIEVDTLTAWAQAMIDHEAATALGILAQQFDQGKDATQLLMALVRYLRNLLMVKVTQSEAASNAELRARLIDEPVERLATLEQQAQKLSVQELLLLVQLLMGAYELIRRSPMASMILELVILKVTTREEWQSLDQLTRRLEQLSQGASRPTADSTPLPARPVTKTASVAPAPVASSATTSSLPEDAELSTMWPRFLERLGMKKMSLAAYLSHAKPLTLTEGKLTVGVPSFSLHQEVLSEAENRKVIEALLTELLKTSITVDYTTVPHATASSATPVPAAAADVQHSGVVQDIVNLFNATLQR